MTRKKKLAQGRGGAEECEEDTGSGISDAGCSCRTGMLRDAVL